MKKLLVIIFTLLTIGAYSQIFITEDELENYRISQNDFQTPTIPIHEVVYDQFTNMNNYVGLSNGICCLLMLASVYKGGKRLNKNERK